MRGNEPVALGSRAREVLVALVESAGKVVRKSELRERVWPDTVVEEGTLRVHIAALRRALGDQRTASRYVENVTGHGYRFVAPVTSLARDPSAAVEQARIGETPHSLPASLSRMFGRELVVATLTERLRERRFMTLVGPGGVGKTTVAVSVTHVLYPTYPHGVCFVDLASVRDPQLISATVAAALGLSMVARDATSSIVASLKDKQILIVLDNCEHLIDGAAVLAERLLGGASGVHILATSREPLRAKGEWVFRLGPLELPPPSATVSAAAAAAFPAIQLFAERVAASCESFELTDADVPIVADICRRVDGLPLAIELAAARVDLLGIRGLAARLDDRLRLLTRGRRTALMRHRTLRATLDWSYELLSPFERAVLRRLAVFAGSFDVASASFVAAATDGDVAAGGPTDVFEALSSLGAKSLLGVHAFADHSVYQLLETSRAYALEKLANSAEDVEIRRRHAMLCCTWGASAPPQELQHAEDWLAANGQKIDDVRAALDWCFSADGDAALGAALTAQSAPFWFHLCLLNEYRERLVRALDTLTNTLPADPSLELQLNLALGNALVYTRGSCAEATKAFATALELAERLDQTLYRKRVLWGLWVDRIMAADYRSAVDLGERYRRLTTNGRRAGVVGDRMMALAHHLHGGQGIARHHAERVLRGLAESPEASTWDPSVQFVRGTVDHRVAAHAVLAPILWIQGFPDQALQASRDSVRSALTLGHALSLCYGLTCVSGVALWRGDLDEARRQVAMLLEHASRHALSYWQFWGRCLELVLTWRESGVDSDSRLDLFRDPRCTPLHIEALGTLVEDSVTSEVLERAKSNLAGWCAAELLRAEGEALLKRSYTNAAKAETLFEESLEVARRQGAMSWELRAAMSLARLRQSRGAAPAAFRLLSSAYGRFTEGFETADLTAARSLLLDLAVVRRMVRRA